MSRPISKKPQAPKCESPNSRYYFQLFKTPVPLKTHPTLGSSSEIIITGKYPPVVLPAKEVKETKEIRRSYVTYHFQVRTETGIELFNPSVAQRILWTLATPFITAYYRLFKGSSFNIKFIDKSDITESEMQEKVATQLEKETGRKVVFEKEPK
ncbi:MAG: hypothetical protein AABX38_02540 [Candidatus Micrarchaeota archaeon]